MLTQERIATLTRDNFYPPLSRFTGKAKSGHLKEPARVAMTEEHRERFHSRSANHLLEFYDNGEGLMLDGSFRKAFSEKTVHWITGYTKYRKLCERLGYDVEPAHQRISSEREQQ